MYKLKQRTVQVMTIEKTGWCIIQNNCTFSFMVFYDGILEATFATEEQCDRYILGY